VVGVSATVNSLAWSVRSTFALFYVALLAEFGWRRGDAALGYSLSWLLLLVFSPLAGRLSDRWGARLVVPIGGLILAGAMALTGQVTALWHYFLVFGVMGAAGIGFIQTPATALVSRWFMRSRGAAMGVVSAGASASAIVFYPLNAWLIVTYGWRVALVLFGIVLALGTIPLAAMFYREPPSDRGDAGARRAQLATRGADEWTLELALRSTPFWAVSSMWILGAAHGGGGIGGFIGPFLGGWLYDVTGSYHIAFAAAAVAIGGSAVAAWIAAPRRSLVTAIARREV
jgi:MFS family permease